MTETGQDKKDTAIVKREPTQGEKFTNLVVREFGSTIGDSLDMTPYQRHLAQHLFIKIDATLKDLEAKRTGDRQPVAWSNINLNRLAIDAVHRIDLGLDALIANHIHPIPYWNSREGKYNLDLRIGYVGKDFYRRRMAVDEPQNIIYELVYSADRFVPIKRTLNNAIESYEFEVTTPFDRGEIVGGFGYIVYADSHKNQLVIVTEKDFQKSMARAKTQDFWTQNPVEMRYKTLVLRVTEKLQVDPRKVNESYLTVEAAGDEAIEGEIIAEIEEKANQTMLDVDPIIADRETGEIVEGSVTGKIHEEQPEQAEKQDPPKQSRDPASLKTISAMLNACHDDFRLEKEQVLAELGVKSHTQITESPADCYRRIEAVRVGPEKVVEGEPDF